MPVQPIAPAAPPAPAVATTILGEPGVQAITSVNDGTSITLPNVSAGPLPTIEGLDIVNRGEEAVLRVLHAYVGEHRQGSLLALTDLPPTTDLARLVRLGAIEMLKDIALGVIEDLLPAPVVAAEKALRGKAK